jgi:hypothetical protein
VEIVISILKAMKTGAGFRKALDTRLQANRNRRANIPTFQKNQHSNLES